MMKTDVELARNEEALRILRDGLEIIKKGWARSAFARNKRGLAVPVNDPSAVRFCAVGALQKASGKSRQHGRALDALAGNLPYGANGIVAIYNDKMPNREPIVRLYERAIEGLEQEIKKKKGRKAK